MTNVEVRDPQGPRTPPRRVLVHDYWTVADEVKKHPNEWCLIFGGSTRVAVANAIRRGVRALPKDEFQMMTENNTLEPPRTCDIYLKYTPPKKRRPQI